MIARYRTVAVTLAVLVGSLSDALVTVTAAVAAAPADFHAPTGTLADAPNGMATSALPTSTSADAAFAASAYLVGARTASRTEDAVTVKMPTD